MSASPLRRVSRWGFYDLRSLASAALLHDSSMSPPDVVMPHLHTLWEYTSLCFNTLTLLPHCFFVLVVTLDFVSLLPRFSPPVLWKISSYPLPGCLLGKLIWCVKFTNPAEGCACYPLIKNVIVHPYIYWRDWTGPQGILVHLAEAWGAENHLILRQ